jgi:sarcosine/dimethylglycine N-methyltransferase
MINFAERIEPEKKIFKDILQGFPAKSALDAGCGSGFHTVVLSQLSLSVTGMDTSAQMLKLAKRNCKKHQVTPSFVENNFIDLNSKLQNKFDAVFCLGNSFVHLLSSSDQHRALSNFRKYLHPGGYLCIQIVNYDKVLKDKQHILAVRDVDGQHITRLYSFNKSTITFTVKVEKGSDLKEYSTELYPMQSENLLEIIQHVGFKKTSMFGDLKLNNYKKYQSNNLCVFCY